jgi:hypothetical protein
MRTDDPFIFLFFPLRALKKVKCLIQDKFDLNLHYRLKDRTMFNLFERFCMNELTVGTFDFNDYDVVDDDDDVGFRMLFHCSFSFKEAINSFGNDELKRIFSSNPEDFGDFSLIFYNQPTKRLSSAVENIEIDSFYLKAPSYMNSFHRLKNNISFRGVKDIFDILFTLASTCAFIYKLMFDQFSLVFFITMFFVLSVRFHSCYRKISLLLSD